MRSSSVTDGKGNMMLLACKQWLLDAWRIDEEHSETRFPDALLLNELI